MRRGRVLVDSDDAFDCPVFGRTASLTGLGGGDVVLSLTVSGPARRDDSGPARRDDWYFDDRLTASGLLLYGGQFCVRMTTLTVAGVGQRHRASGPSGLHKIVPATRDRGLSI